MKLILKVFVVSYKISQMKNFTINKEQQRKNSERKQKGLEDDAAA